jgi:hypothetical protein
LDSEEFAGEDFSNDLDDANDDSESYDEDGEEDSAFCI